MLLLRKFAAEHTLYTGKIRRAGKVLAEQARPKEFPWKKNKAADVYIYF